MLALKRKQESRRSAANAVASRAPLMGIENTGTSLGVLKPGKVKKKRTPAELRIQSDLSLVEHDEAATLSFPNLNNLTDFRLTVAPRRGPWMGGEFEFVFCVPQTYPYSPPRVSCESKIYHPNVSLHDGGVCLELRDWWKPVHDISYVIHGLVDMFYEPVVDLDINQQAAALLNENREHFLRVVTFTCRRTNDSAPENDQRAFPILDHLPPDMLRNATDFMDEESVVKFFIVALGSAPHRSIYTSMAHKIVQGRFASLQQLVGNPLPVVPPARVPPIVPPALIEFVGQYVSHIDRPDLVSDPSAGAEAFERARLEDHECDQGGGDQGIVQAIKCLSGHMAVLHYFRDTIASNTKQDILWPVWCGKLQLDVSDEQEPKAPFFIIATPVWYPRLIGRCKRAFTSEYQYQATSVLHGLFDIVRQFERGFHFTLATVTGVSVQDREELSSVIAGRSLNRVRVKGRNAFRRITAVPPGRARELLQRLEIRAQARANRMVGAGAADRIEDADLPVAQYQRIIGAEGEGSSQLFVFWQDDGRNVATAGISCQEFTNEVVELLTTRKSVQLRSTIPEYWLGEWAEPPTMMWSHP